MSQRYHVRFNGPLTTITSCETGPWPRWEMARAAIEHLEDQVRECQRTVMCLRRAASFGEYLWLVEEMVGSEEGEEAQVEGSDTLN